MKPIPEAIVEKTWQEVAGFSPDRAKKEMMKIGNTQPDLLAFVTESSHEMGQEVTELAIYMFVVVYRMFQKAEPLPIVKTKKWVVFGAWFEKPAPDLEGSVA